jgi:hypothetical protein
MTLRNLLEGFSLSTAPSAALALNGPQAITIGGGPLGQVSLSGDANGGFYVQSNASPGAKATGAALDNALIEL